MDSLNTVFENNNIMISLRYYGPQDLATGWEVKSIVENPDIFDDFYSKHPLLSISNIDDYYLYLLSLKFSSMREVIPVLLQKSHKEVILTLSQNAELELLRINPGDVIEFINKNIEDIFDVEMSTYDIRFITLDLIAKYITGIRRETLEYLCKKHGYLLIDRFDQFEKSFERYPDLFECIYPTGHLDEINSLSLETTLEIWNHIHNKANSNLKGVVEKCTDILAEDIKQLSDTANVDNIMQIEGTIRKFCSFLQRTNNPKANEYTKLAKVAAELLSKNVLEKGHSFQYEIPVGEIVEKWKVTKAWEIRLLSITHAPKSDKDSFSYISRLSVKPKEKHSLIDYVSTNIPTDDYYTTSHQQNLSVIASIGAGTLIGIIGNKDTMVDYLSLVSSAVSLIVETLHAEEEQLQQDVEMLSAMVQLIGNNFEMDTDAMHGICYGASMYACAIMEKLLRILNVYIVKDEIYIPLNKATLGELLTTSNGYLTDVFGDDHIKNLSFFLQKTQTSNVGENIRNSLAHWANVSKDRMTNFFFAKILWLFTDILNTVFWYCLGHITDASDTG